MASTSPRSLTAAGNLLIAAGFVAAFTGGLYGLALGQPGFVVLSVLLVIGYSVAGYLLLSRRESAFPPALALSGVLILATLGVLRPEVARFLNPELAYLLVFPVLGLLLAFAGAHLLAYAVARRNPRVLWPSRGTEAVQPLLTLAAVAPVFNAFILVYAVPGTSMPVIAGGAILAAVATAFAGVVSSIRRHPRFTLFGAAVGFLASVAFLFEFAPLVPRELAYWGQLNALAGMLLSGFPLAMGVVAWVELEGAKRAAPTAPARVVLAPLPAASPPPPDGAAPLPPDAPVAPGPASPGDRAP